MLLSGQTLKPHAALRIMRVTQADFRTIQIEQLSISCRLRYSIYQDGEIRYPESITCRGETVVAYFLTSTIRDFIVETAHGFCVQRHWKIVAEGSFGLGFCLEVPADSDMAFLFPGVSAGRSVPRSSCRAPGERTCYANGLYLFGEPESMLIFCDSANSFEEAGSMELQRVQYDDDVDFNRAELRVPAAAAKPSKKDTRRGRDDPHFFRSEGQFEYNLCLNVVIAPKDQIHRQGISAVLERNPAGLHTPQRLLKAPIPDTIEDQIHECLGTFLLDRGPLCGLLEAKGENKLSSLAGCTMALIQLRYQANDEDAVELARRLADFSLKGQHPRGQFYPHYWKDRQTWLPTDSVIAIPLDESAAIALMLLRFAAVLHSRSLPASAYLHAVAHMADSLLQSNQDLEDLSNLLYPDSLLSAGPTENSPVLVELFLQLHKATGKDVYRKAVRTLKSKFFSQEPQPLSLLGLDGNGADLDTMLLQAQAAASLDGSGYPVKGLHRYFDALLSRVYLNRLGSDTEFNPMGGISPSLGNPTMSFRGFELAHTLLSLDARMKKSLRLGELDILVSQLLGFTLQKPMGTSCYDPQKKHSDPFGPPDSYIWTRELYYMTRLFEEFPEAVPQ